MPTNTLPPALSLNITPGLGKATFPHSFFGDFNAKVRNPILEQIQPRFGPDAFRGLTPDQIPGFRPLDTISQPAGPVTNPAASALQRPAPQQTPQSAPAFRAAVRDPNTGMITQLDAMGNPVMANGFVPPDFQLQRAQDQFNSLSPQEQAAVEARIAQTPGVQFMGDRPQQGTLFGTADVGNLPMDLNTGLPMIPLSGTADVGNLPLDPVTGKPINNTQSEMQPNLFGPSPIAQGQPGGGGFPLSEPGQLPGGTSLPGSGAERLGASLFDFQRALLEPAFEADNLRTREQLSQSGLLNSPTAFAEGGALDQFNQRKNEALRQAAAQASNAALGAKERELQRAQDYDLQTTRIIQDELTRETQFNRDEIDDLLAQYSIETNLILGASGREGGNAFNFDPLQLLGLLLGLIPGGGGGQTGGQGGQTGGGSNPLADIFNVIFGGFGGGGQPDQNGEGGSGGTGTGTGGGGTSGGTGTTGPDFPIFGPPDPNNPDDIFKDIDFTDLFDIPFIDLFGKDSVFKDFPILGDIFTGDIFGGGSGGGLLDFFGGSSNPVGGLVDIFTKGFSTNPIALIGSAISMPIINAIQGHGIKTDQRKAGEKALDNVYKKVLGRFGLDTGLIDNGKEKVEHLIGQTIASGQMPEHLLRLGPVADIIGTFMAQGPLGGSTISGGGMGNSLVGQFIRTSANETQATLSMATLLKELTGANSFSGVMDSFLNPDHFKHALNGITFVSGATQLIDQGLGTPSPPGVYRPSAEFVTPEGMEALQGNVEKSIRAMGAMYQAEPEEIETYVTQMRQQSEAQIRTQVRDKRLDELLDDFEGMDPLDLVKAAGIPKRAFKSNRLDEMSDLQNVLSESQLQDVIDFAYGDISNPRRTREFRSLFGAHN